MVDETVSCVAVTGANQTAIRQLLACQAEWISRVHAPEGARFEVYLSKARGVFGEDALAFEAKLELDEEGAAPWVCTDLKSEDTCPAALGCGTVGHLLDGCANFPEFP
jgi:hypothetical protein